jgi:L-aminopeptidase/D-esterase-like protein
MTGTHLIDEAGVLIGPVMLTNTVSLSRVRNASIRWQYQMAQGKDYRPNPIPVVAETWDGYLNDIMGDHITEADVFSALNEATSGPLAEGNVGGGTGMSCFGYKCGTGTSSRTVDGGFTVGVIVQANHGARERLIIAGVPVGAEFARPTGKPSPEGTRQNSIIVVLATDAPLLPHQSQALAKRATVGVGRTGGVGEFYSGDLFIAFSTANPNLRLDRLSVQVRTTTDARLLNKLYDAAAQATEEAIMNAMVAAETMVGFEDHRVEAIAHDKIREAMRLHSRLTR